MNQAYRVGAVWGPDSTAEMCRPMLETLLRFWVKSPNTNSKIGKTRLARVRARGIDNDIQRPRSLIAKCPDC
jgi:hypothetical protein